MSIILSALQYLGYILIFPGFLFCFLGGMLLCGIDRKIVAKMQKRVGPPVLQPFYDFFKLCGKETIVPAAAAKTTFLMAPLVGLAALVVIQLFIPVFHFSAFSGMADIIVILYLLLIPALSIIIGGAASGSPYAGVGLSREMVTVIACELPLVLVLLAVAKTVGSALGTGLCFSLTEIAAYQAANGSLILRASMIPAALAFLLVIPGETGNHPFDAAEAETEICEGMLAEYSGPPLAVYKLSHAIKMRHRRKNCKYPCASGAYGRRGRRTGGAAGRGGAVPALRAYHHRLHLPCPRRHRQAQDRADIQVLLDRRLRPGPDEPGAGLVRSVRRGEDV